MMKHIAMMSAACALCLSCGGDPAPEIDDGPVTPPDNPERTLPVAGPGDQEDLTVMEIVGPGLMIDMGSTMMAEDLGSFCCPVVFALTDDNAMEDEVSVRLQGSAAPLQAGLELSYADGVWSAEACVPPEYSGYYTYSVTRQVGDDVVEEFALNTFAPRSGDFGIDANVWLTSDTCEGSRPELHGVTSD